MGRGRYGRRPIEGAPVGAPPGAHVRARRSFVAARAYARAYARVARSARSALRLLRPSRERPSSERSEREKYFCLQKIFLQNKFCLQNLFCEKTRFCKKRVFSNSINPKVYRGMRFFMYFACNNMKKIEFHDTPGFIELRVNAKSLLFANNAKKRQKNKKILENA